VHVIVLTSSARETAHRGDARLVTRRSSAVTDWYAPVRPWLRLVTAILIVVAIAAQCQSLSSAGLFEPANVFSFFTIQSNILTVFVLLGKEFGVDTAVHRIARAIRPGVVLYMSMTGVVYAVLLAPVAADVGLTAKWVDAIVHVVAPIVIVADWFLAPPARMPEMSDIPKWLVFPVAWLVYSLVRGGMVDWYPYPFIDPRPDAEHAAGSWGAVAVMVSVVAAAVVVFAWVLAWLTARRMQHR
jgi:hypothetical protein